MNEPSPKVNLVSTEEYYEFHFTNGFIYDIWKEDCSNERRLNEWIAHLAEKNWWSKQLEEKFIESYKKENGR